ncbi:EamA family transporter [Novosphingobium sp.]|uniref:EamA family transporter n=1 Tax=Novosphingobium sp. TaxID=1874826 RepID=UPI00286E4633|nr:EamA family transporter [Novosphingobium sp.]
MTNNQVAALLGISALLAAGQTLFKFAAMRLKGAGEASSNLFGLALIPSFWLALVLYGLGTLLWIYILQTVPLSRAYPFMALAFVMVPLLAVLLFSERLNLTYAFGALLIVAGVVVTARA